MAARGFLGAGDLYIARQVGGVFQEYEGPFECSKFEIKPAVDWKEMTSKSRDSYGQTIESVPIPKPTTFTVELGEVNRAGLAIALLGTVAALSQGAGTLTDEVVTAKLDKWVPLSKANLQAGTVVTNSAGSTTFVNGTDYIVNPRYGWIKALSTGSITEGQQLKVDATYDAITGDLIRGSTQNQIRAKFKLDGKNFVDDSDVSVTVHEGVIAAESAFDFLADNFNAISMPGRMKVPAGATEPYTVELRTPA